MAVGCIEFLTKKRRGEPPAVLVIFGDDDFLCRQASMTVREWTVGRDADDFTLSEYTGADASLSAVFDDLATPPFLGDRRLVVVEDADKFVTAHREALLKYVEGPSPTGVLLLEVKTWTATTKLAKAVELSGLAIEAKSPKDYLVPNWCVQWAKGRYDKTMAKPTADWLVELVGAHLGQLDQEIAKLVNFVGDRPDIGLEDVNRMVAGTRTENAFKLLDLLLEGHAAKAIQFLDRQLVAGDSPIMIMAMLTAQLKKLTRAARAVVAGTNMDQALRDAGVPPFAIEKNCAHLRHFGRERMAAMYRRLLEVDLDIKGGTALEPRFVVERFLIELARPQSPARSPR
ncbi:MAG: DNA polymerase III subunit delta [Planctomycetota bacterium]